MVRGSWWRRTDDGEDGPAAVTSLQVGQVWRYLTRPGEEQSRVRILVLEDHPDGGVVHVRVEGVHVANPVIPASPNTVLGHVPIERSAFHDSLVELESTGPSPEDSDLDGYRQWRDAEGGVFTLSVAETVEAVDSALNARPEA